MIVCMLFVKKCSDSIVLVDEPLSIPVLWNRFNSFGPLAFGLLLGPWVLFRERASIHINISCMMVALPGWNAIVQWVLLFEQSKITP